MVISIEPGLVRDDGVFQTEENLIVTGEGCEILAQAPQELWTLG